MSLRELLRLDEVDKRRRGLEFVPREIAQQPITWRDTFRVCTRVHGALADLLASAGLSRKHGESSDAPSDPPTVVLTGAGTSAHAGYCVEALFRKSWGCETRVLPSTDLVSHETDHLLRGRKYFFVSFSRSGMSPEGVAVIDRLAKNFPAAWHLVVTCNAEGLMVHAFANHPRVFCLVLDDAVNDRALAMTSSFSNMVVAAQYVASLREPAAYGELIDEMSESAESFLEKGSVLAERLAARGCARACFLGSGPLYGVARESAFKVLELIAGRVPTIAESFLGLRHGPLSFIDRETLVVAYLSGDRRRRAYELDLLGELRKKKLAQSIVAVSRNPDERARAIVDHLLTLEADDLADDYRPPLDVGFGQVVALFLSMKTGLLPDSPSANGAISRVVSGVRIHA
jgi:tagatose-6-phosphate ketose/aldose isomerase